MNEKVTAKKRMEKPFVCNETREMVYHLRLMLREENAKLSLSRSKTASTSICKNIMIDDFIQCAIKAFENGKFAKEW